MNCDPVRPTVHEKSPSRECSLYFTQSKTSDVNATARRLIEDALLRRYERRAALGEGWRTRHTLF